MSSLVGNQARARPRKLISSSPYREPAASGGTCRMSTTARYPSSEHSRLCAKINLLEETQLLTVAEVARRLQQSERTVRDRIASGALSAVKQPGTMCAP